MTEESPHSPRPPGGETGPPGVRFSRFRSLLSGLLLGLGLLTAAHAAGPYNANQCAGSRFGSNLGCNANDVSLNSIAVVGSFPSYCVGGATIPLDLQVTINFGSSTRYDVGVFLSQNGTDPSLSSSGNNCNVAVLPTSSPFWNSDGDLCGDGGSNLSGSFIMSQVTVPCTTNGSGNFKLYVPYVISWDQQSTNYCGDNTYPVPGTTSKCNSGTVNFPPGQTIVVLPAVSITDGVTTVKSGDSLTYTIVVSNTTGSPLASGIVLTDPAVTDLSVSGVSCSGSGVSCPSGVTVANLQGSGITLPAMPTGSSLTFTVSAQYTGNPSSSTTLTNTATATMGSYPSSASDTDTVMVPPTATKSFSPGSMAINGTSQLIITLTNPDPVAISGAAFTDSFPSGLKIAGTPSLSNSCGGTATGAAGSSTLSLTGGSIAANSSCSVKVNVTSATAGSYTNSTGSITTSNAGTGTAASGNLVVMSPPTVSESFTPSSISYYYTGCSNCTSTLAVTIGNANSVAMTGVVFTDTYSSTSIQNTTAATYTCTDGSSGSASGSAGGSTLGVSGLSVPANGSCTVSVTVKETAILSSPATYYDTNTGTGTAVTSTNAGSATGSRAALTVEMASPTVTKSFSPAIIASGGTSTLTLTLANPSPNSISNASFTDTYPTLMFNAATPAVSNGCGGTYTATAGAGSLSLSNATIPAGSGCSGGICTTSGSCAITVKVTSSATGTNSATVNSTNALSSLGSGTLYVVAGMTLLPGSQSVANDGVTAAALTATVYDTSGNYVPGDTVTLSCNNHASPAAQSTTTNASGQAVFYVTDTTIETVTCTATDSAGISKTATITFSSLSGFNAFETSTAASAVSGRIYTKLAGTAFGLDVVAVSGSSKASSFSGNVKVELLANTGTPGSGYGSDNCPTSNTVIQTIAAAPIASGRSTVNFSAVSGAYQDVRVRITYQTIVVCSTDGFAIRPTAFTVTSTNATNTGTSGSPTFTTGSSFNLTATAVANYAGTPGIDTTQVIGSPTAGTLAGSFTAASSGTASGSFTYTEVGNFGLNANAVYDQSYVSAAVDPSGTDCVAGSYSNTLSGGMYGCWIGSNAVAQTTGSSGFGRFIPDHFGLGKYLTTGSIGAGSTTLTLTSATGLTSGATVAVAGAGSGGGLLTATLSALSGSTATLSAAASATVSNANVYLVGTLQNRSDLGSNSSSFTYMDEPMKLTFYVTAYNGSGHGVAQNYAGSYAKLDATTLGTGSNWFNTGCAGGTQCMGLGAVSGSQGLSNRLSIDTSSATYNSGLPSIQWASGVGTVTADVILGRCTATTCAAAGPDGPYDSVTLAAMPHDSDGITLPAAGSTDMHVVDVDATSGNTLYSNPDGTAERRYLAATAERYGRLRIFNAYGSELLQIRVPVRAEYCAASSGGVCTSWQTNTLDSQTSVSTAAVAVSSSLTSVSSFPALSQGTSTIVLNKPSGAGTVSLAVDLGTSGSDGSCNGSHGGSPAAQPWLRYSWCSGSNDPNARATFGTEKNRYIYLRERY